MPPAAGTLVELPIGEPKNQQHQRRTTEGELNELGTVVTITLPDAIAHDLGWRLPTGLVKPIGRERN